MFGKYIKFVMLKTYKYKAYIKIIMCNMNIKAKRVAKTERCSAAGRKTNT